MGKTVVILRRGPDYRCKPDCTCISEHKDQFNSVHSTKTQWIYPCKHWDQKIKERIRLWLVIQTMHHHRLHWNRNAFFFMKFSWLVTHKVVILKNFSAVSDEIVVKMTTNSFQCSIGAHPTQSCIHDKVVKELGFRPCSSRRLPFAD